MLPYESMNRTQILVKIRTDDVNGDIAHGFLGDIAPVYTYWALNPP